MNSGTIMWHEFTVQAELILRLIVAGILGIFIGFERKNRNKMAGVRTHAIVAFGAALMMVVSKYGFADVADFDASRIASQIVSGVGFLGAGIIFVKNNTWISGLTTAAGIWATAGVGMSVGAGLYFVAIASGILLILLQETLHRINFLSKESYRAAVKVIMQNQENCVRDLEAYILSEKLEIESMKLNKANKVDTKVEMVLVFPSNYNKTEFIDRLADRDGVISVRG